MAEEPQSPNPKDDTAGDAGMMGAGAQPGNDVEEPGTGFVARLLLAARRSGRAEAPKPASEPERVDPRPALARKFFGELLQKRDVQAEQELESVRAQVRQSLASVPADEKPQAIADLVEQVMAEIDRFKHETQSPSKPAKLDEDDNTAQGAATSVAKHLIETKGSAVSKKDVEQFVGRAHEGGIGQGQGGGGSSGS
jgi:hypothetical protein